MDVFKMTTLSEGETSQRILKHDIAFGVTDIELPPLRDYYYVNCVDGDSYFKLERFEMEYIREEFANRAIYELPPIQGDRENLILWVNNMWEAMYNPLWMRKYEPPNKREWNYGVFDGHHRMRLFDALDANIIWAYVQNVRHFPQPTWVKNIKRLNVRPPRRGTHMGICIHCNESARYRVENQPNHRLMGGRLICSKCGEEIPYPWPGVL